LWVTLPLYRRDYFVAIDAPQCESLAGGSYGDDARCGPTLPKRCLRMPAHLPPMVIPRKENGAQTTPAIAELVAYRS